MHTREIILSIVAGILLFLALILQDITSEYKHFAPHISVDDLAFSFIPMYDFSWLYYGEVWILLFVSSIVFFKIKSSRTIPLSFIIFCFAVLFAIRSLVLVPTGVGTPMNQIIPSGYEFGIVHYLQNDMFFSGHTSTPFLLALLFWKTPWARYFFLAFTVLMAYSVLSMRIHYSIDVIGAIFGAHFSYHLSHWAYFSLLNKIQPENNKNNPPSITEN